MESIIPQQSDTQGERTKEVLLPTGLTVTIREQNGNDDDTISEVATNGVTSFSKFLSDIIIAPRRYTQSEIERWKTCDRYYLMLASRIFTFGPEFTFEHEFKDGTKETFDQDLGEFMSVDFKDEEDSNFPYRAKAHQAGEETNITVTLTSGKKVKYDYMNGAAESLASKNVGNTPKRNDEFRFRNLQLLIGEKWQTVLNFKSFSAGDMRELRAHVRDNDYEFAPIMVLTNPNTGQEEHTPVIGYEEFFFPL